MGKIGNAYIFDKNSKKLQDIPKELCIRNSLSFVPVINRQLVMTSQNQIKLFQKLNNENYEELVKDFGYRKISNNLYFTPLRNNQFMFITIDLEKAKLEEYISKQLLLVH